MARGSAPGGQRNAGSSYNDAGDGSTYVGGLVWLLAAEPEGGINGMTGGAGPPHTSS